MEHCRYCCPIMKFVIFFVSIVCAITLLTSCIYQIEDITIYNMLEDDNVVKLMVSQYNKAQRLYKARYRTISPEQLQDVLENNIERKNIFMLLTRHDVSQRAGNKYLVPMFPRFNIDARVNAMTDVAQEGILITNNMGVPLYMYDILNETGVSLATLSIPAEGFKEAFVPALTSFFQFIALPEVNSEVYVYDYLPVYIDANVTTISSNKQKDINLEHFPLDKLGENMDVLHKTFTIAR